MLVLPANSSLFALQGNLIRLKMQRKADLNGCKATDSKRNGQKLKILNGGELFQ